MPVIVGPHMYNFEEMAAELLRVKGLLQVASAEQLTSALHEMLNTPVDRSHQSKRATQFLQSNKGALLRQGQLMMELLEPA